LLLVKKMQLPRWNNANPTPKQLDARRALSMMTGLDVAETIRLRWREKNVLDIPFYRTGVSISLRRLFSFAQQAIVFMFMDASAAAEITSGRVFRAVCQAGIVGDRH
jgi:hypothetical protein